MTDKEPREWYLNPIVGYKCEVNENSIGLTGNEVHVIEHSAYLEMKERAERAEAECRLAKEIFNIDHSARLAAKMNSALTEQLTAMIKERDELKVILTGKTMSYDPAIELELDEFKAKYNFMVDSAQQNAKERDELRAKLELVCGGAKLKDMK